MIKNLGGFVNIRRIAMTAAAVTLLVISGAAPAIASVPVNSAAEPGRYCVTVVKKLKPGQETSELVSRNCTSDKSRARSLAPAAAVPLVTFYEESGFNRDPETGEDTGANVDTVYGDDGPCDALGYGFSDLTDENDDVIEGISSFTTDSNCGGQTLYNAPGYVTVNGGGPKFTRGFALDYVGLQYNDRLYSMKVYE